MDKRASVCVGLTSEDYSLSKHIGREAKSFGYYSEDGRKYRNGDSGGEPYGTPFSSTEVVGCGFNTITREIFFTKNGTYLGVAFWDIPEMPLYPSVSLRGVVGLTCVAQFHPPFKFDLHTLPYISPSMWSESLGDPTLSDEQVLYPPSSSNSRLQPWESGASSGGRELRGLHIWPANDVAIWLESIGYGLYRKEFYNNNISGRHLHSLNHQLLKNELGIESYGHRADILDRVNKLLITWKEKVGTEDANSSLMDSTDAGSGGSDFTDYTPDHANGANLLQDSYTLGEEVLQPLRPPLLHHPQAVHRFSDHENSEDEGRGGRGKRTGNASQAGGSHSHHPHISSHANTVGNLNTLTSTGNLAPANINPTLVSLVSSNDKDAKWRRRTVPCPDVEVRDDNRNTSSSSSTSTTPTTSTTTTPMSTHTHHTPAQLNHRPPGNRPRTNTGNLPLPNGIPHIDPFDIHHDPTGHNHKPKPMQFQNHLAASTLSSSPPVIHTSHTSPVSHMSTSLSSLPLFTSAPSNNLIPTPIALHHSTSATGITQNTPPKRSGSPLARSLLTTPASAPPSTTSTPITSPETTPATPHPSSTPGQLVVSPSSGSSVSPTKTSGELAAEPHEWEIDFNELELGAVIGMKLSLMNVRSLLTLVFRKGLFR